MKTARRVYEDLVEQAKMLGVFTNQQMQLEMAVRNGRPIPDKLKPGALIAALSEEERKALEGLSSEITTKDRVL